MVSSYNVEDLLSFIENVDLLITEGWTILMKQPCVEDNQQKSQEKLIVASMDLQTDKTYKMHVWMPKQLAIKLCIQFYGDMELDDEMIIETVGEFLNIVAGNIQGIVSQNATLGFPVARYIEEPYQTPSGLVRNYRTPDGFFGFAVGR